MGKKRSVVIGSPEEDQLKVQKDVKREQKKLRESGKTAKAPGLGGGQRVVDSTQESLREYEELQKRQAALESQLHHTPEQTSTPRKNTRTKTRSQPYRTAKSHINSQRSYSIAEGLSLLRQTSLTKFDPTVELHIVLKESPKAQISVTLPVPTGKTRKVAVFSDSLLTQIESGKIDFDLLVASPSDMPQLVKFAKILGPKGLMPNPKTGTVSDRPQDTAKKLSAQNTLPLKTEKDAPVIHTVVGKLSASDSDLSANILAVLSSLPPTRKAVLKSTMSPAIKLQT